jgi:hypothetical protein
VLVLHLVDQDGKCDRSEDVMGFLYLPESAMGAKVLILILVFCISYSNSMAEAVEGGQIDLTQLPIVVVHLY